MCGQHNARVSAGDNTRPITDNDKNEIKISDRAENRTGASGLEARDSTYHARATNQTNSQKKNV